MSRPTWTTSAFLSVLLRRLIPTERQRLLALTIVIGGLCGLAAVAFHLAINKGEQLLIERALSTSHATLVLLTILTPALGGLIVGLSLYYWVPGAVGSGIPQVKVAYELESGFVPMRDAAGKFILGAIQVGSGGSLGREGPTVQICAGIASWLARAVAISKPNQRRMTAVGVAAGIAAAFNAPIAAVTFTLEEVVGDLDQTMLSGIIVAAAIAAVVERSILGQHPVFEVLQPHTFGSPASLLLYAILGVLSALVSVVFTDSLLGLRACFKQFTAIPKWVHPAIGGALAGCCALAAMLVFHQRGIAGGGYQTLALVLSGAFSVRLLLGLCVLKLVATVCSYSSGGVGGIFAPALFIGATLGGVVGYVDFAVFHHSTDSVGAFALVGMGAVFAGIIRAPITSVLIIFELTGGYGLILPLMISNMTAYGLARRWRQVPVYEALLVQDGVHLSHEHAVTAPAGSAAIQGESLP